MKLTEAEQYATVNRHPDFKVHGQGESPAALGFKLAMQNPRVMGDLCPSCFQYHRGECA